jgi:hypothetical protein
MQREQPSGRPFSRRRETGSSSAKSFVCPSGRFADRQALLQEQRTHASLFLPGEEEKALRFDLPLSIARPGLRPQIGERRACQPDTQDESTEQTEQGNRAEQPDI